MKIKIAKIIYRHIRNPPLGLMSVYDWKIMKSKFEFGAYGKIWLDSFPILLEDSGAFKNWPVAFLNTYVISSQSNFLDNDPLFLLAKLFSDVPSPLHICSTHMHTGTPWQKCPEPSSHCHKPLCLLLLRLQWLWLSQQDHVGVFAGRDNSSPHILISKQQGSDIAS